MILQIKFELYNIIYIFTMSGKTMQEILIVYSLENRKVIDLMNLFRGQWCKFASGSEFQGIWSDEDI